MHCNYKPHSIECNGFAEYKLIETDTGKEFFVCANHVGNYRAFNDRAGRESYVIIGPIKALIPEEGAEQFFRTTGFSVQAKPTFTADEMWQFAEAYAAFLRNKFDKEGQ